MIAHERTQPTPADRSQSEAARRSAGRGTSEPDQALAWGYREVAKATSLSRRTIEKLVATGQFPQPHVAGGKRLLFDVDEVRTWLKNLPRHAG